jgi:hypothetical protein
MTQSAFAKFRLYGFAPSSIPVKARELPIRLKYYPNGLNMEIQYAMSCALKGSTAQNVF